MKSLLVTLLLACAPSPKMPAARCMRVCPVAADLAPRERALDDCCTDVRGETWSSCAWNRDGRWR